MFLRSAILSLAALAAAKEMPKDEFRAAELFDSGIRHENNKALKLVIATILYGRYDANLVSRKPGLHRKLLESMPQHSTLSSHPLLTAPMELRRRQLTRSAART
jgi:hypothetical protein